MNEVVLDIRQWGNNLGVRLPATIARAARLTVHQRDEVNRRRADLRAARVKAAPWAEVRQRLSSQ